MLFVIVWPSALHYCHTCVRSLSHTHTQSGEIRVTGARFGRIYTGLSGVARRAASPVGDTNKTFRDEPGRSGADPGGAGRAACSLRIHYSRPRTFGTPRVSLLPPCRPSAPPCACSLASRGRAAAGPGRDNWTEVPWKTKTNPRPNPPKSPFNASSSYRSRLCPVAWHADGGRRQDSAHNAAPRVSPQICTAASRVAHGPGRGKSCPLGAGTPARTHVHRDTRGHRADTQKPRQADNLKAEDRRAAQRMAARKPGNALRLPGKF